MKEREMEHHCESLMKNGFVHIKNAIEPSEVLKARAILDSLIFKHNKTSTKYATIHQSSDSSNYTSKILEINHAVKFERSLKKSSAYTNCKKIAANLSGKKMFYSFDHTIYKQPDTGSISWHQDQAYKTKVKNMQSLHFWIPLHDVSHEVGGMQYVRGSHKSACLKHSKHEVAHSLAIQDELIENHRVEQCDAKIGDVIIHLPLTIHSSLPNKSNITRKAWILHFSPYGRIEPFLPHNLLHYLFGRQPISIAN